jgi:hypothetical protein
MLLTVAVYGAAVNRTRGEELPQRICHIRRFFVHCDNKRVQSRW